MTTEPLADTEPQKVPYFARVDVIGGAVMICIAALVWFGAINMRVGGIVNFGPGAVPRVLATILFLAGAALLIRGLVQRDEDAESLSLAYRPPLILGLAIVLFALFIRGGDFGFLTTPRLGLMIVGPITVFIAGFATPEANPKELLIMAFGLTAAVLLVFPGLLGVPIPVFPDIIENAVPNSFGVAAAIRVLYVIYAAIAAGLYVRFYGLPEWRRG